MEVVEQRRRPGPVPAVMTGPLAPFEAMVRQDLTAAGYRPSSVAEAARTMRWLSGWMQREGVTAQQLTPLAITKFLIERRRQSRAQRWVGTVVRSLRQRGLVPGCDWADEPAPVDVLLAEYRVYLAAERGLAAESVRCLSSQARKFLSGLPKPLEQNLMALDAATVTTFIVKQSQNANSVESAKALVTATRSLLRFLHVRGLIAVPLAAAVPGVAGWRLSALPRGLSQDQVHRLLSSCDTKTSTGMRDHAILTMLARLGLRGAEVAALTLDDVDWRNGEIVVRGKGSRVERLPLPAEVGQALAAYVTMARPGSSSRALFVTARAPFKPVAGHCIRAAMGRACQRAGISRVGAHRLRHTLATDLLRAGASLPEIGQLLRHRSQLSTAVYAKVDLEALRALARPWPGRV